MRPRTRGRKRFEARRRQPFEAEPCERFLASSFMVDCRDGDDSHGQFSFSIQGKLSSASLPLVDLTDPVSRFLIQFVIQRKVMTMSFFKIGSVAAILLLIAGLGIVIGNSSTTSSDSNAESACCCGSECECDRCSCTCPDLCSCDSCCCKGGSDCDCCGTTCKCADCDCEDCIEESCECDSCECVKAP